MQGSNNCIEVNLRRMLPYVAIIGVGEQVKRSGLREEKDRIEAADKMQAD